MDYYTSFYIQGSLYALLLHIWIFALLLYMGKIYITHLLYGSILHYRYGGLYNRKLPNTVFTGIRERGATNNKVFNYVYIIAQKVLDYNFIF